MLELTSHYQGEFASFWSKSFPNKPCPPLPKQAEDLTIEQRTAMEMRNPVLYQNLFRSSYESLPCDTADRLQRNQLWVQDIPILEKHGWVAKANELRIQGEEGERLILEKRIAESQKRQEQEQAKQQAYANLPLGHPMKQPTQESIQQARAMWGISGQPIWDKGQD